MSGENVLDQDGYCGIKERQWAQRRAEKRIALLYEWIRIGGEDTVNGTFEYDADKSKGERGPAGNR
jgi:hypothetical protein